MKTAILKSSQLLPLACLLLVFSGCATTPPPPQVTPDGLSLVKGSEADLVYVRPGVDLSSYNQVALLEPEIAFRKNWQSDTNFDHMHMMNRVGDSDVEQMIETGKKLLLEEFTAELKKGGYEVVDKSGPRVLAVKAAIVNLDIFAPDPNDMANTWTKTYTEGSGEATLFIELFDSVTGQLLVRAFDHKSNENDGFSWRIPRSRSTNIQDARSALGSWAEMLVHGLDKAKTAKAAPASPSK